MTIVLGLTALAEDTYWLSYSMSFDYCQIDWCFFAMKFAYLRSKIAIEWKRLAMFCILNPPLFRKSIDVSFVGSNGSKWFLWSPFSPLVLANLWLLTPLWSAWFGIRVIYHHFGKKLGMFKFYESSLEEEIPELFFWST